MAGLLLQPLRFPFILHNFLADAPPKGKAWRASGWGFAAFHGGCLSYTKVYICSAKYIVDFTNEKK
jgi:hypothetical protein